MFNEELRKRSYKFAKEVILALRSIPSNVESRIICGQLIKSSSSVAANFRAACVSRSQNEWYAKMCIVTEEADESCYWLELIIDLYKDIDQEKFEALKQESNALVRIFSKVKNGTSTNKLSSNRS